MYFSILLVLCLSFVQSSLQQSFQDILSSTKNLSSFSDALTKYNPDLLTQIGSSSSPITILAPSNAAFAKTIYYPVIGPAFSHDDIGAIKAILDYHVVVGNHSSSSLLPTFQYFPTWLTNSSFTNVTDGQRVGGVMQGGTEMFWVSGQSNRSPVITTDISFEGGTVHIIDSLLIPPSSFPATSELFSTAAEPYQLTSFLGAIYYPSNSNTTSPTSATLLNTTSDVTIFAPNNVAMESVASALMSISNTSDFEALLQYHIIVAKGGPWYSTDFTENGTVLESITGGSLTISFSSNSWFINSARLLTSDLLLANGVMHVIDNVLSPSETTAKPNPSLATQVPVLSTAGSFNISAAPFTTFLPNTINTNAPTSTAGGDSYGGGPGATTTGNSAATATATKGGAGKIAVDGRGWLGMSSLMGVVVLGAAAGMGMILI